MRLDELASIILFLNESIGFDIIDSKQLILKSKVLSSLKNTDENDWIQSEAQLLNEFLEEIGCCVDSDEKKIKECIDIFMEER